MLFNVPKEQLTHSLFLLQRHIATVHASVSQSLNGQPREAVPPSQMSGWMGGIASSFAGIGIRHISGAPDPNTSTSTARGQGRVPPAPNSAPDWAAGDHQEVPREDVGREPAPAAPSESSKASLVVSCPLCLDNASALTTTLCGHVFCKEVRYCHLGIDSHDEGY
jgi:hypothetical protein